MEIKPETLNPSFQESAAPVMLATSAVGSGQGHVLEFCVHCSTVPEFSHTLHQSST